MIFIISQNHLLYMVQFLKWMVTQMLYKKESTEYKKQMYSSELYFGLKKPDYTIYKMHNLDSVFKTFKCNIKFQVIFKN